VPDVPTDPPDSLHAVLRLADQVCDRRAFLQREIRVGYEAARTRISLREAPTGVDPAIPGGMLEALSIAGVLGRDTTLLDAHYTRTAPGLLAKQLTAARIPEEPLFTAPLRLSRMPRLAGALGRLYELVRSAGLPCEKSLGAATPEALLREFPTLAELFSRCHFGRSMPMLYAAPGDVAELVSRGEKSLEEWIDARYTGPLIHELAHLQPLDPGCVPAPGNLHEALAAWLGSEAFPEQLWPDPDGLDALPGGGFFASVGGWLARTIGVAATIRVQGGALELRDALGEAGSAAMRLYGWLPHLETSAPHLLADTFSPQRWWKLIELQRDPETRRSFEQQLILPLLENPPPALGSKLVAAWNDLLDRIDWPSLPVWSEPITLEDEKLGLRACQAICVRAIRSGGSFRAVRQEAPDWPSTENNPLRVFGSGPLRLDTRTCLLRANWPGPDAVGAPAVHPVPPPICAAYLRAGFEEVRATSAGLPPLPDAGAKQIAYP
jgi:hypothetical protein